MPSFKKPGKAVIEKVIENAHLHLRFRRDMQILFLRWSNQVQDGLLQKSYLEALDFARELNAHSWMFDLRGRGAASAQDEAWILEEFFPAVDADLEGPNYFAYLLTPKHFAHIHNVVGIERLSVYSDNTHIQIFMSESDALEWLLEKKVETVVPVKREK